MDATAFLPFEHESRRLSGLEEIESAFVVLFDRWRETRDSPPYVDIEPLDTEVVELDDCAILTFHLTDGPISGRRTLVFHREEDAWRIAHLHASNGRTGDV